MKSLLTAIKSQLQTDITYVRDREVYITEDEDLIPGEVKFPAIGLKDGPVTRKELAGGMWEVTLFVDVIVYVGLEKAEAAVMGDAASSQKGVLDIEDDILSSLDDNLLDISGMQEAFAGDSESSQTIGDEKDALQKKKTTFKYVKEEDRP